MVEVIDVLTFLHGKRAGVSPQDVALHHRDDETEGDIRGPEGHGSDDTGVTSQQKYIWAVKVFEEYREGRSFVDRVNRSVLSRMCEDRGLSTEGLKLDLFSRLNTWVCRHFPGLFTFSLSHSL